MSIGPLWTNFSEISKYEVFIHENSSENTVCEKAAILSRGRWVNIVSYWIWYLQTSLSGTQWKDDSVKLFPRRFMDKSCLARGSRILIYVIVSPCCMHDDVIK